MERSTDKKSAGEAPCKECDPGAPSKSTSCSCAASSRFCPIGTCTVRATEQFDRRHDTQVTGGMCVLTFRHLNGLHSAVFVVLVRHTDPAERTAQHINE